MSSSIPFYLRNIPDPLPPPSGPIRESVADIVDRAHRKIALNWNKTISLGALLRSYEKTVLYQGAVYVSEGDYVQGYIFAITWIKQHPDQTRPQYKVPIQHVQDLCKNVVLKILSELKPLITEAYEKYLEQQARGAKRRLDIRTSSPGPPATLKAEQEKLIQRQNHQDNQQHDSATKNGVHEEPWDLLKQMEGIKIVRGRPQIQDVLPPRTKLEFKYPTVFQQQLNSIPDLPHVSLPSTSTLPSPPLRLPLNEPIVPPKSPLNEPIVPPKPPPEISSPPAPIPTPPPSQDLTTRQFAIGSHLENGHDLRSVFIPSTLRERFLKIAEPNTNRNLETCGILCGVLRNNAFIIGYLIIPPQTATADSCTTTDEESLFEFQDKHSLLTLGWIHTHPTQTCFMSSVDLHTHVGYQLMLPEAIAIVCAPSKKPSWGVFRLTDPPGVKTITDCRERSLFHPHPIPGESIYRDCWRGTSDGHVREMPGAKLEVVDLRK